MKTTTVAIIGAGIAGLAVAALLERRGVECAVFDQSETLSELGAGIQISPNGARLLHRLGLRPLLTTHAVRPEAVEMYRWCGGERLARTQLGAACADRYGAPYYLLRRADLHRGLRDLVAAPVYLGRRCVALAQGATSARVQFAGGDEVVARLVIGADGVHSAVRRAVHGGPALAAHLDVYRGLVPARRFAHRLREPAVQLWLGPGQHCVSYPVPGWISFVASVPEDHRSSGHSVRDLLAAYRGWHPQVRRLLGAATLLARWSLCEGPPLQRWTRGRVSLVGDAAHAMVPVGAQGATQALEDAAALAACLEEEVSPAALTRYEQIRRPRIAQVAAAVQGHAQDHHLADGVAQRRRDARLGQQQELSEHDWLYGYDAAQAVRA